MGLLFIWQLHGLLMGRWGCNAEKGLGTLLFIRQLHGLLMGRWDCSAEKGLWDLAVHTAAAWVADGSVGL